MSSQKFHEKGSALFSIGLNFSEIVYFSYKRFCGEKDSVQSTGGGHNSFHSDYICTFIKRTPDAFKCK